MDMAMSTAEAGRVRNDRLLYRNGVLVASGSSNDVRSISLISTKSAARLDPTLVLQYCSLTAAVNDSAAYLNA
jgi:hypothetical protein